MIRPWLNRVRSGGTIAALLLWGMGCASVPLLHGPSAGHRAARPPSPDSAVGRVDLTGLTAPDEAVAPEQQRRSVLFARARLLEADHQPLKAARLYSEILEQDPNHAAALHRLAVVSAEQGDVGAADVTFQQALRVGRDNARLHSDFGYLCYLLGRWGEAEEHLLRAIQLDPSLAEAHNNLGLLAARRGETERAIDHCCRAGCTAEDARHNIMLIQSLESELLPPAVTEGDTAERAGFARVVD